MNDLDRLRFGADLLEKNHLNSLLDFMEYLIEKQGDGRKYKEYELWGIFETMTVSEWEQFIKDLRKVNHNHVFDEAIRAAKRIYRRKRDGLLIV